MEEILSNTCVQHDADSSLANVPKKTPRLTVKKVTKRLTKITTKRRKYEKSKKEVFLTKENILQNSLLQTNASKTTDLLPVIDLLEKHSFKYEVLLESNKHNFFFQDKYMNIFSNYYPEYICVDFLCEIPDLELNLCLFTSIDGNGYCEIVSVGLIKTIDSGLLWLCDVFKKYNPNWHKIRFITCDKKARIFEVIKMAFPEKLILISFFHSMKILRDDLSDMDCEISSEDTNKIIHIFEQMVFACDEFSYSENLKQLKQVPVPVTAYFRKIWHQKKDSWAWGPQLNSKTFLKSFNSFLLNIRKKLRPMVNTQDTVKDVVERLCNFLDASRKNRFEQFTSIFETTSIHSTQTLYQKYSKYVTQYAAELICEQFKASCNVKNIEKLLCGKYICASEDIVTTNACSCNFFQFLSLPCCHIFAIRKQLYFPFFVESLCSNRWRISSYHSSFLDLQNISISKHETSEHEILKNEQFQKYFRLCAELWPLILECPEMVSLERLKVLSNLVAAWENYIKVSIEVSDVQKNISNVSNENLGNMPTDYWREMYGISLQDIFDTYDD